MLNIVVAGPGAVGQVLGGMLALEGHQVTFLAREGSQRLDDINRQGVSVNNLRDPSQSFTVPARAVASLNGARPADLVLLTTKTYSTDAVLHALKPVVGQNTLLMSLQNGVESADKMRAFFQRGIILGAFCFMGGAVLPTGVVSLNSPPKVVVGDLDGTTGEQVQSMVEAFTTAKIPTERSPDIRRDLWIKLLWNVGIFQWCAIRDYTIGDLLSDEANLRFVRDTMLEAVQVARASGVNISETDIDLQIVAALTKYAPVTPSLLQDLRVGRPLEHDSFAGFISRRGKILGTPTPHNDWLFGELTRLIGNRQL